jgi:hypothetical protein
MKFKTMLLTSLVFFVLVAGTIKADAPDLSLTLTRYDPYPAQPGGYLDLWIQVNNQGLGDASNLLVQLQPEYPFSVDPGANTTTQVAQLNSLDSIVLHYVVRVDENAITGINKIKVKYQTGISVGTWNTASLDVYVLGKSRISVSDVSPMLIEPGQPTMIAFTLKNAGGSPIRDLMFSWKQPSDLILPVGSDNRMYIGTIGIGEQSKVVFTMTTNPDIAPGVYPVVLTMNYTDGNTTATSTSQIGIIVGGTTDFDVSAEGSGGQVSLSISNIGANNANSVTVEIPPQQSFSVTGGSSSILGNLDKGDYTTATFQIAGRVSRNVTGGLGGVQNQTVQTTAGQNLTVRISYTDTTGQRQTVEKQIAVPQGIFSSSASGTTSSTFTSRSQSSGQGLTYIIIGAAGIAAVIGFFLYRRKKRKKKK